MKTDYILQIETSTKNCSVALSCNGETIASKEIAEDTYSHAENLHVFVDELLRENSLGYHQLAAVAVSKGPGSYTGLRIGVSAAKGFCFALDIPLIGLSTLEILSKRIKVENGLVIPMLDARRMEVYAAVYSFNGDELKTVHSEIIGAQSFSEFHQVLHLIGDGAFKAQGIITSSNLIFYPDIKYPSAKDMSLLAFDKFQNKQFESVAYFEPYYLKEFFLGN